jgi:cytochrome c biogenesis protein CcmG/thiol:disulfide interchange protein DsbE
MQSPQPVGRTVDVEAPDMTGRLIDVGEARGRVRVVDFWATWCEPCLAALERLDRLAAAHRDGLVVYAVSLDEERAPLEAFLAAHPLGVEVLWDQGGRRHAEPLRIEQLPTTLLVDRAGVVRFVHRGWHGGDDEAIRHEVGRLLAEGAPASVPP